MKIERVNGHDSPAIRLRQRRLRVEVLEDRSVPALVVNDLTTGLTPQNLASFLAGSGVAISNVTYQGTNTSSGEFSGGTGIIGFESGIILSSGQAKDVVGPNKSDSTTTSLGTPGDAQLAQLANTNLGNTFDATTLEFNFVPQGRTLSFQYVFSSEEYNEFVQAGFNDVFGFFLNGQNVALIPGTNTPVGIDTVNLTTNSQDYINNARATDPNPAPGPLLNTEMDGLTVVLTVTTNVTPNASNHFKLSICDVGDSALDSNVFIQSGSFVSPPIPHLNAFRPYRYAFRSLEQNQGLAGPLPIAGPADSPTFDGNVTVVNIGNGTAVGPVQVVFHNLPPGVTLLNATGSDAAGNPFIIAPVKAIPASLATPLRIPVKFSNPLNQPLGTFFVGPYFMDVSSS